jgi:ABC-type transport system involved in cytochrome bd biosynthesis fused ATPase/permease subunit
MIEVLTKYGLYDRFKEREGLDTLVVDDILSYGEQQIFFIVRALLQKTRLVLLDEPTSR